MVSQTPIFHLLVVDDNPTNLELMARIVESRLPEVRCFTAANGEEAFQIIAAERIDGAFVDIQMPKISGFDVCRQLKADPKTAHIPVVLLTAHVATPQSRAEGLDAGAQDFISQPVSNIEMLARIRVMLRLQRERTTLASQNQKLHQQVENNVSAMRWLTGLVGAASATIFDPQLLLTLAEKFDGADEPSPDQFANWLLPGLPKGWQKALLQLALLETIPLDLAVRLSPLADIGSILDYLWRHNYHVDQIAGGYRFDGQLHGYLKAQAQTQLSADEQVMAHRQAADWHQEKGDYCSALRHFLEGQLFEEVELLLSQTGLLLPLNDSADACTLLPLVPEPLAAKHGWFSLFVGSCKLIFAPAKVENWLELARVRFVAAGDQRGELLALSQQVHYHLIVDGRLALGRALLPRMRELLSQQQDSLDAVNLSRVLLSLALGAGFFEGAPQAGGEYGRQGLLQAQKSGIAPLAISGRVVCGFMALLQGKSVVACSEIENAWQIVAQTQTNSLYLQILSAGLLLRLGDVEGYREQRRQLAEQFDRSYLQQGTLGVELYLFDTEACLLEGDWGAAVEMLRIGAAEGVAAGNPHLQSWLLQYQALLHAHSGLRAEALQAVQESLRLREQAGGGAFVLENLVVCAETLFRLDALSEAQSLLHRALDLSLAVAELFVRPVIHAALARIYHRQAATVQALDQRHKFCPLLDSRQHKCCFFLIPDLLATLHLAMENDVQPEVACRLAADILGCDMRNDGWLVPHLNITLLGPFRLQVGSGTLVEASSLGAPGRHLLGLLIFAPGQQLAVDTIYGHIWPETSPERARQNFDSTLMRLRNSLDDATQKSIGRSYLAVEKGVLSLRHARVDALDYKLYVEQGRKLQRRGDLWQAYHKLHAAERQWQGRLMEGFDLPGEFFDRQEVYDELRCEQIELFAGLAAPFCNPLDIEKLLLCGLQVDPIRDSFIKGLLLLYRAQKDNIKPKRVLQQYRESLLAEDFTANEVEEIMRAL